MNLNWTKRPDCSDCNKPESAIIYSNRPLCFPCSKKNQAKQVLGFLKENLTREEISSILVGENK